MPYTDIGKAREANRKSFHKYKEQRHEYGKKYYLEHKEDKLLKSRIRHLRKSYNLTLEDFVLMWERQDGRCYICAEPLGEGYKCHVDHDHVTNKVRKLLCKNCNNGIGFFKESSDLLFKAFEYLEEHKG